MTETGTTGAPGEFHELEPLPAQEAELQPLETLPDGAQPAASGAAAGARSGPRELERAPQVLQKAAVILLFGALLPWLTPEEGWDFRRILAKVVVLIGGYVAYLAVERAHGAKTPLDVLAGRHPLALPVLSWVVMLLGVAPLIDPGYKPIAEKASLAVAILGWCQVHGYAKGGKFNPSLALIIPMFGLAGLIMVFLTPFMDAVAGMNKLFAMLGSIAVTAAGAIAGYTMFLAMKEAKAHGEAKKRAAVEARKLERSQRRGQDAPQAPGMPPPRAEA